MTQENKEILLKILSEQLPYGVIILDTAAEKYGKLYQINSDSVWYDCQETEGVECQTIFNVKPYLRPMSSMTKEEENECIGFSRTIIIPHIRNWFGFSITNPIFTDWLNAHHFDYRGLIEKGLALEAPEEMYKTK